MAAWHRSRRADFGLRALGSGLCVTAWLAVQRLVSLHVEPQSAGLFAYALAFAGFICASAGSAMTILGAHLFDEVEVSARWQYRPPEARSHDVAGRRRDP